MTARSLLWLFLAILPWGCVRPPVAPPLPATVRTVAVLPPNNRTGDPLLIASASWWDPSATGPGRRTVADALVAEARAQLARQGITVVAPEAVAAAIGTQTPGSPEEATAMVMRGPLTGSALYIEIRRWESDTLHPRQVLVALDARMIDVATGRVVWRVHRPLRPVPTPGAVTRWVAYTMAVRHVIEELLAPPGAKGLPL